MPGASLALPPSYRQRALKHLATLIAQAEDGSARRIGRRPAGAGARPSVAEAKLAILRRSREYLLTGELPETDERR